MAEVKPITARAIRPNAGLEAAYRRRLKKMMREMHQSVLYWLTAEYRRQEDRIVMDESPVSALTSRMEKLFRQWRRRLDETADEVARWYVENNVKYSKTSLMAALKEAGFTVEMVDSRHFKNIVQAAIGQNVNLIKSIGENYYARVQGAVMRSVMAGRDLGSLVKELKSGYGITARRAELIARDQTQKAMNALTRARYEDMGVTRAIWRHNAGGSKTYRDSHVDMDGHEFDLAKGMWDPAVGKYIQPGELPFCKCTYRAVLSAFGREGTKEAPDFKRAA
jgi:Uncharacterized protein, homolog of phage Mu protein gp30